MATKNKLIDVETLEECWSVLDREYGNSSEIRAKLKQSIASIKLKATSSPHNEIELFEQVQTISAKIRAAGGSENLTHDSVSPAASSTQQMLVISRLTFLVPL